MDYNVNGVIEKYIKNMETGILKAIFKNNKAVLLGVLKNLYERNGYRFETAREGSFEFGLLYFAQDSKNPDIIVSLINNAVVSSIMLADTVPEIEKLGEAYGCKQFNLLSVYGFEIEVFDKYKGLNFKFLDLDYIYHMFESSLSEYKFIELFEHNYTSYSDMLRCLDENGKAAVVQATGTGKGYIIWKYVSDHPNKKILVAVPSLHIVKQLFRYFGKVIRKNVSFVTYSKLSVMEAKEIASFEVDTIILDEFHRAGAEKWGEGVKTLLKSHTNSLLIGTTATPIRFLNNNRNMIEELFDGSSIDELPLPSAIVRGILPNPVYITALYSLNDEISTLKEKIRSSTYSPNQKYLMAKKIDDYNIKWENTSGITTVLSKHIKRASGKYIVFCRDKAHIDELKALFSAWFKQIGFKTVRQYSVYTAYTSNNSTIREFEGLTLSKDGEVALLFCVDMLNEGLHIPGIAAVFLMRKTVSPIIFLQQIGRALTAGAKVQPLIFDLSNNFSSIKGRFFYDEIRNVLFKYNKKRGSLGLPGIEFTINITDETLEAYDIFSEIETNLMHVWDLRFDELVEYKQKFGDCLVPKDYEENEELARWVLQQRMRNSQGYIIKDKKAKLESIDFVWNVFDNIWNSRFEELVEFRQKNGSCAVPNDGSKLGNWVVAQRSRYKKGELSDEQILRLNDLGFIWNTVENSWNTKFNELLEYKNKFGTCVVIENKQNKSLCNWMLRQRIAREKGRLSQERIDLLNGIGFLWDNKLCGVWNKWFAVYKRLHEGKNIGDKTKASLNNWLSTQRNMYKEGKLKQYQIDLLNSLNIEWSPVDRRWEFNFQKLVEFKNENACLDIPPVRTTKWGALYDWAMKQKRAYHAGLLSQAQIQKLESISFDFGVVDSVWSKWFNYYKRSLDGEKFDSTISKGLRNWTTKLRNLYRLNNLEKEKIAILNSLGFAWEPAVDKWDTHIKELKKFRKKYGHCNVAFKYKEYEDLYVWCTNIRSRHDNLSDEKVEQLVELGFIFDVLEAKWEEKFEYIKACNGSYDDATYKWVYKQRKKYKNGTLPEEKAERLRSVGIAIEK